MKNRSLKSLFCKEDQLYSDVIVSVNQFIEENMNQKLTKWNSQALLDVLREKMKETINKK